jgi:hypothetical protein
MDLDKVLAGMFFLILTFLLLSRASEFNGIIQSVASFVTSQTQVLQGVGYGSVIQGTNQNRVLG